MQFATNTDSPSREDAESHWAITCPNCKRPTPATGFYCVHDSTLVAFAPRRFLSWSLVSVPFALFLALSIWRTHLIIYATLAIGITAYFAVAFRRYPLLRFSILLWTSAAFLIIASTQYPELPQGMVANIGFLVFFFIFLIAAARRAHVYLSISKSGVTIVTSVVLASITFYSLVLELAWAVKKMGMGELWLVVVYNAWVFWIIIIRATLVIGAVAVLAIEAAYRTSTLKVDVNPVSAGVFDALLSQMSQWADYTYLFARILLNEIRKVLDVLARMTIRMTFQEVIPGFIVIAAAWATMWTAVSLFAYVCRLDSASAIDVAIGSLLVVLFFYSFAYLEFTFTLLKPSDWWPWRSILTSLRPYWHGALADALKLLFHLSWIIPLTTVALLIAHVVSSRLNVDMLSPGTGLYFVAFLLTFAFYLSWGYMRSQRPLRPRRKS